MSKSDHKPSGLDHVQAVEEAQAGNLREQWDFMDSLAAADEHSSLGGPLSPDSNGQHFSGQKKLGLRVGEQWRDMRQGHSHVVCGRLGLRLAQWAVAEKPVLCGMLSG